MVDGTLNRTDTAGIYKNVWLEMVFRIIQSSGIQRGKRDKIDYVRITLYVKTKPEAAVLITGSNSISPKTQGIVSSSRKECLSQDCYRV